MKLIIARQEFSQLINKAINIISPKPTIPILSNLLLEARNNQLILTATDLTVGIRCLTEAKILEEGATTVPAKKFASLIKELTAHHLEITVNPRDQIELLADSSLFKLHGMNKNEFPSLPDFAGAMRFQIKQGDLKDLFFRTSFAVSRDDNRYALTGVCMQIKNGSAAFVGTDGRRLARAHHPIPTSPSFTGEYIFPLKAVEEIVKNLAEAGEEECTVALTNDKVSITTKDTVLITKLLAGDYPDVGRVIPEKSETVVSLHREELMTLLRQIALFTTDNSHSVRFTFEEGELKLTANTSDVGEGKVSMSVNYRGPRLEAAFNPLFFLDILRHSKQETVTLGLTDAYNPGVITDTDVSTRHTSSPTALFIIMPMRLNEE